MFLLDTNVISETVKSRPHSAVMRWLELVLPSALFLCAISIAELQRGAERIRAKDPAKAAELDKWIELLLSSHTVLAFDVSAAREWARLHPKRSDPNIEDSMIAAIARVNGLTVVTRRVKDFNLFAVPLLNPFD